MFSCLLCAGCLLVLTGCLSSPVSVSGAAGKTHKFPKAAAGLHGATGRSANGAGTAREGEICLHQTVTSRAPSAAGSGAGSCSVCCQLCLLPSVPDASPGSSPCVPIPGSTVSTGTSPAGWNELLRDATSAAVDGKYLAALWGAGRLWESGAQQCVQ